MRPLALGICCLFLGLSGVLFGEKEAIVFLAAAIVIFALAPSHQANK